NIIDNMQALDNFLADFSSISAKKILIHGGGKLATELSSQLGIETKMVEGRRITDEATIRIVTMTYAGFVNKTIVAKLQAKKTNALGLSGADAKLIPAVKRPVKDIDYGFVGDIEKSAVNAIFLKDILSLEITPVIAPISADENGQLLNINADTIAKTVAEAMTNFYNVTLVYCFEKNGLLCDVNDDTSVISEIDFSQAETLKLNGTITAGMIPKVDNALEAISNGVSSVVIGHAKDILQIARNNTHFGTRIK
ncbi:MAG TPA: acetylglutamate kinase, partial [Chitinophagales bacterium]